MRLLMVLGFGLSAAAAIVWLFLGLTALQSSAGIIPPTNEPYFMATFFGCFVLVGLLGGGLAYVKLRLDELGERLTDLGGRDAAAPPPRRDEQERE
jgi:hypothetical protein